MAEETNLSKELSELMHLLVQAALMLPKKCRDDFEEWCISPGKPPEDFEALRAMGLLAYKRLVAWFGPPEDRKLPCEIRVGYQKGFSYCSYNLFLKRYIISVTNDVKGPLSRKRIVCHEMYHRVTSSRSGIGNSLWIDEMMAQTVAGRIMREQGHGHFIDGYVIKCRERAKTWFPTALAKVERKPIHLGFRGEVYPAGFQESVTCLGAALSSVVAWEKFCALIDATSLEEWITTLPEQVRYSVCRLLEHPYDSYPPIHTFKGHLDLGYAFLRIGQYNLCRDELNKALSKNTNSYIIHSLLGLALEYGGHLEEAIEAQKRAVLLNPLDAISCFQLGQMYRKQGKFKDSIDWLQRGVGLRPHSAPLQLYLGITLKEVGKLADAREALETVLRLGDEEMARDARKVLAQSPFH